MSLIKNTIKIKVRSLFKSFRNSPVLSGIDLDILKDTSTVILGGSGAGKSVLIKSMIGLLYPDHGSIMFDDIDTTYISGANRLKILKDCGFLFQGSALFDSLTVQDNITFFAARAMNLTKNDKKELATEKLLSVGLQSSILNMFPSDLSGGMQKRVALARTICTNPKVIFFDEPTTGLDPVMANVINDLIIRIRQELKATTITITHDIQSTKLIAQKVAFINAGRVVWYGPIEAIEDSGNTDLHYFLKGIARPS